MTLSLALITKIGLVASIAFRFYNTCERLRARQSSIVWTFAAQNPAKHAAQCRRVLWRMGVVIIIEVDPGSLGPACLNSVSPCRQLAL